MMLGVEMPVVERLVQVLDIGICFQTDRILEQAEIQVSFTFDGKLADVFSQQGNLSGDVVVEEFSLFLNQLSTH